ncbi:MAG TPA: D-aminoacyl-tRNA deacylase [Acidimicrobiia bacterium]|nr:D-aminoacyl-tRNA deacylase [Acidimicrobiia bacterium]
MRIVVQRVTRASVEIDGVVVGSIDSGFLLLVGIEPSDTEDDIARAVEKVGHLRVFPDEAGQMNRSLLETDGSALVVSQFTLLGDLRKGRRPSFVGAAPPQEAEAMVDRFVEGLRRSGVHVETGVFGSSMNVELVNSGPVTILLEIRDGRVT